MKNNHNAIVTLATIIALVIISGCWPGFTKADEFVLVQEGQSAVTIVTAADAAIFATELQHHVQNITGATLPIKPDAEEIEGSKILVGFSSATAKLGLRESQFKDQE